MNKKIFYFLILFITIFFIGCKNKEKIKEPEQSIENVIIENSSDINYLVKVDDDPNNDNLIYVCKDRDCFLKRFKICQNSQIFNSDKNITYVIIGLSFDKKSCQIIVDKIALKEKTEECFIPKNNLTENLFENLYGNTITDTEQNIIKESCKEINL